MRQRKKKHGVRGSRKNEAHTTITQHQPNQIALDYSGGLGPLLVGRKTEPGDLDLHFEYISEAPSRQKSRSVGVRVQLSKWAMIVVVLGSLLSYAVAAHDRELVREGLDTFKALFGSGIHTHNPVSPGAAATGKPKPRSRHGKTRGDCQQ